MLFAAFIIALLSLSCQSPKINYEEKYETLLKDEKYDELHEHLKIWESKEANNPEMYIAYFNYYTNKGKPFKVLIDKEGKDGNQTFTVYHHETGEAVDSFNGSLQYDKDDFIKAVEYLDKGLSFAPNRLDMRFGKISTLNKIEHYKEAGNELYTVLKISKEIDNNWLWVNNEKMENGESFFFSNIGDYYQLWFDAETEESLAQVKQCIEKQIELYSGDIFSYDILGIYYYIKGQFQETLKYFLQAEMIDPNDCITLMKVGQIYLEVGNKQKAQEYFTKILKIGNERDKEVAEHFLSKTKIE
jgi:tetratricopeptide (TPR) repeat protein